VKLVARAVMFVLLCTALFGVGYGWRDLQEGRLPTTRSLSSLFGGSLPATTLSPEQVFKQTYTRILGSYYKPVKPIDLKYAAMSGLMGSLGDPHTMFMAPQMARDFSQETKAKFVGVGARLQPDPLGAKVAVVFEGGPADRSGLKVGDLIVAIDGERSMGKDIDTVVGTIKGKEGTIVRLTVVRAGQPKPLILSIRRARVITPTVESRFLKDSGVGYMTIATFSEPTADQFDHEMDKLSQNRLKGLVIDLRGNPGGLLETAVDLLSRFTENNVVVKMRFRDGHEEVAKTFPGIKRNWSYPVVILMNEESASAAEIFAGALHDYKLATIVGTHSYGKASVQNVFELVDGSSAKITIARYFLPWGENIGRKVDEDGQYISGGLEPDIKVEFDPDGVVRSIDPKTGKKVEEPIVVGEPKTDVQLKRAIDFILRQQQP
jgi:carboxyl-terminal processing protease